MQSPATYDLQPLPQGADSEETYCCYLKGLHGPDKPGAPLFGSSTALEKLRVAVEQDGLFIQPQTTITAADNVKLAYQHLQQRGEFPRGEAMRALDEMGALEGSGLGIVPEDHYLDLSIDTTASPPFKMLSVARALVGLRIAAKYHQEWTTFFVGVPQQPVYSLGVVTMIMKGSSPSFKVDLYPSMQGVEPTAILWMYRWCVFDGHGDYSEDWRALSNGHFRVYDISETESIVNARPIVMLPTKKRARSMSEETADESNTGYPTPDSVYHYPTKRQRRTSSPTPTSSQDEDLFTTKPDSIRGPTILRLARHLSNLEIFERINEGLVAKGERPLAEPNVITRRITVALQGQAARSTSTKEDLRKELNEARKANGVVERMNVRTAEKKFTNKQMRKTADRPVGESGGTVEEKRRIVEEQGSIVGELKETNFDFAPTALSPIYETDPINGGLTETDFEALKNYR